MIKSWRHKGLKLFYSTGITCKIQAKHADKLHDVLQALDFATQPKQMRLPGLIFTGYRVSLKIYMLSKKAVIGALFSDLKERMPF